MKTKGNQPRAILVTLLLVLQACVLFGQTEAESASRALIFQDDRGGVVGDVVNGEKVKVYPRDRQQSVIKGNVQQITDSTIVVNGRSIAIASVGSMLTQADGRPSAAIFWFLGSIVAFIAALFLFLLIANIYFFGTILLVLLFSGFIIAMAFIFIGLVMGFVTLMDGKRKFFNLSHYSAKVIHYLQKP